MTEDIQQLLSRARGEIEAAADLRALEQLRVDWLGKKGRVTELLKHNKMEDVLVLVGGIIPDQDMPGLKENGVSGIFQPGTSMDEIIQFIRNNVKSRGIPAEA